MGGQTAVAYTRSAPVTGATPEPSAKAATCTPTTGAKTSVIIRMTTTTTLWSRRGEDTPTLAGRNRCKRVMAHLGSDQPPRAGQGQAGSDDQARIPLTARGSMVQLLLSSGMRAWVPVCRAPGLQPNRNACYVTPVERRRSIFNGQGDESDAQ